MEDEELNNLPEGEMPEEDTEEGMPVEGEEGEMPEDMGEEAPEESPMDKFRNRIRTARPDANYDDDDNEYYNQGNDYLDEVEEGAGRYKVLSEKLMRRFEQDPYEAQAIMDYLDGEPLVSAIRKNMGDEALQVQEGDEGWDEYQKAGEDRSAKLKAQKDLIDEINANAQASNEAFEQFVKDNNMSDEEADALWDNIQSHLQDYSKGKLSPEMFGIYRNAMNYDNDVAGAKQQGLVEGRNAKIDATKKRMEGSGLPNGNAGSDAEPDIDDNASSTADFLSKIKRR